MRYQAVRTSFAQPEQIPESAKISVEYYFSANGAILPVVHNLTDEIMVIDQVKSFIVNTDGSSTSYYDPTVRTETTSVTGSTTTGASVNLGAVASAFGIGGVAGKVAKGVNVGGANTNTTTNVSTVTIADQQKVSVGPNGSVGMPKQFVVKGLGYSSEVSNNYVDVTDYRKAPLRFSVTITYSTDNGATFDKLVTEMMISSNIVVPVKKGMISEGFNQIYQTKPDALAENFYFFNVANNIPKTGAYTWYKNGKLVDWQ